jgi:hypothetical protein
LKDSSRKQKFMSVSSSQIWVAVDRTQENNIFSLQKKGKGHPRTGHEGPEGEQSYSSTLSLTSALDVVWLTPRPGRFK